ncbi:hypothetical protein EP7_005133 [Isosphaeraceae bacterium EP7]
MTSSAVLLALLAAAGGSIEGSVRVVEAPPYYVGQAIEVRVGSAGGVEPPSVVAPRPTQGTLAYLAGRSTLAGSSSIGDATDERYSHVFRYRLVPARAGPLEVPPFALRLGERRGKTGALRLKVLPLPASGRTASFLGGVGAVSVRAEAEPGAVRAGQAFEFRLVLEGPGARGSTGRPAPRLPASVRVEDLPDDAQADPPRRVIRYRLRPTVAGDLVVPPVLVAAFDPASGRYVTRASAGVPVRVVDVPRFDPGPAAAGIEDDGPDDRYVIILLSAAVASAGVLALLGWALARRRRRRAEDARAVAARAAAEIGAMVGADRRIIAAAIMDALAGYLASASGRPRGVVTPDEARDLLGGDAAALVGACDRARFSGSAGGEDLAGPAAGLFGRLASRGGSGTPPAGLIILAVAYVLKLKIR